MGRILIVDVEESAGQRLAADLGQRGHETLHRTGAEAALVVLAEGGVDAVLAALPARAPGVGAGLAARLAAAHPEVPVLCLAAPGDGDGAVAAIGAGAHGVVAGPAAPEVLALAVARAVEYRALRQRLRQLEGERPAVPGPGGDGRARLDPLEQVERRYILHVLGVTGGNRTRAAQILGVDRKTLYRKLLQYRADNAPAAPAAVAPAA